jgi:putative phosphoribosyl transferase
MMFHDRTHAAFLLAHELKKYQRADAIILAIPRGGVPVGYTIAHQLGLPMEVVLVKKIGHPENPEYAIGSVSSTELILSDTDGIPDEYIKGEIKRLRNVMKEKYEIFMKGKTPSDLKGKIAILVDDGLATGNTMLACIDHVRKSKPLKIVVAVPVSSISAHKKMTSQADELICLYTSADFHAVGQFYENFSEVSDESVTQFIEKVSRNQLTEKHQQSI